MADTTQPTSPRPPSGLIVVDSDGEHPAARAIGTALLKLKHTAPQSVIATPHIHVTESSVTAVVRRHDMWEQAREQLDDVTKQINRDPNTKAMLRHRNSS